LVSDWSSDVCSSDLSHHPCLSFRVTRSPIAGERSVQGEKRMANSEQRHFLLQPHAVGIVPPRHVGKNDGIALVQSGVDLNEVYRGASGLHLYTRRSLSIGIQLEHGNSAGFLTERRASYVEHVLQ